MADLVDILFVISERLGVIVLISAILDFYVFPYMFLLFRYGKKMSKLTFMDKLILPIGFGIVSLWNFLLNVKFYKHWTAIPVILFLPMLVVIIIPSIAGGNLVDASTSLKSVLTFYLVSGAVVWIMKFDRGVEKMLLKKTRK